MNGRHISRNCQDRIKVNQAFTIVELLVVILVIGILLAVSFVAYNGVQNSAAETALKSDLQAAAATLAIDKRTNGSYPNNAPDADNGKGLQASNGATYEYSAVNDAKAYCLTITSNRPRIPVYSVSSDGAKVEKGACAGHAEPASNGKAGLAWELGTLELLGWRSVAYSNGKFIIIEDGPANQPSLARISSDGLKWSAPVSVGTAAAASVRIVALNGHMLALFNSGQTISASSTGGTTWQHSGAVASMPSYQIVDAAYGDGMYVGIRSTPPSTNSLVQTSTNGVDWTGVNTGLPWSSWSSIAYGSGTFVAVATSGTPNIMTSEDGVTWTARAAPQANVWTSVIYADGQFVAVSNNGTNRVMTSPDGITWTPRAAPQTGGWSSVAYGDGKYVAVAASGTDRIMTSPDAISWTVRPTPQANSWSSVTYGKKCFVSVAYSGTNRVMRSCD